jgi:hypothetical protein
VNRQQTGSGVSGLARLRLATLWTAAGAWIFGCELCAFGAAVSIPAVEINGRMRPIQSPTRVVVPERFDRVAFWLSPGAGTEQATRRLRYRLEGVDVAWRDPVSEMTVILQTQSDGGAVINSARQAIRGESSGWEGNPATAPWVPRTLELAVTEAASEVRIGFTSTDFKGNSNTLGFLAVDRVQLRLERSGQLVQTIEVPHESGDQMERPLGTPHAWTREGRTPGIARILWRGEPEHRPILLLDDRDIKGSEGWFSKPLRLEMWPGDRLTMEWRTAYSVGSGGDCVTEPYSGLSAGKYTLHVAATDTRGTPTGEEAEQDLVIQPPLAKRTSVWLTIGGLLGGVLAWASRARWQQFLKARRAQSQRPRSSAPKQRRNLPGIPDDLGATLTQVAILSTLEGSSQNAAVKSGQSPGAALELSTADPKQVNELAWAMNPANETLEHFVEYLCEFANTSLKEAGIRFLLEAPALMPDCRLNANQRHQLFLAAKEALGGAANSAGTSEVRLRIQVVGSQLRLHIEDNGRGQPPQSVASDPASMASRMDRVGGSFSRSHRPGAGSCVELSLGVRFP